MFPELTRTWFGGTQNPLKSSLGAHKHTQMRPRGAQEQPRGAQKTSRNAQETPKSSQEVAKSDPKDGKNAPRGFPESSKIDSGTFPDASWARFSQEPLFERLWDLISIDFRALRSSANLDFYCSCQCFVKVEAFTQTNRKCRKKPRK